MSGDGRLEINNLAMIPTPGERMLVQWTTSLPAQSQLVWQVDWFPAQTITDTLFTARHIFQLTFPEGREPRWFRGDLVCQSEEGHRAERRLEFGERTKLTISGVGLELPGHREALVRFTTSIPAQSRVRWQADARPFEQIDDLAWSADHAVRLALPAGRIGALKVEIICRSPDGQEARERTSRQ